MSSSTDPLVVPGSLDSLAAIRDYVRRAAVAAGLNKKQVYRLELAVDEAATNIVEHGYAVANITGDLRVRAELDADSLRVTIEDTAPPFDPLQYASPTNLASPLEERAIGGLGIFLALRGVDDFVYQYAEGRNRSTFVMKRQLAPAAGEGLA